MTLPVFLGNIRGAQLIIIVLVILLLFGGKKIPELMRGLGKGVHAFRQGIQEAKEEMDKPIEKSGDQKQDPDQKE
ncbi:MAG: twin-arginine translocase TatA/TatE family subunit [Muribaculaceae bacterium]|nr:twin-arginine translocase TatA/TatE family subunit [Muribaculaceae bacterium]